jgi:hypothetical protein
MSCAPKSGAKHSIWCASSGKRKKFFTDSLPAIPEVKLRLMLVLDMLKNQPLKRRDDGQQLAELPGSMIILICCLLLPLLNLSIIPLRLGLARNILANRVHQLSLSEKLSAALAAANADEQFKIQLSTMVGTHVKSINLSLAITSRQRADEVLRIEKPGAIPPSWLPNGANAPCDYLLTMRLSAEVDPLITTPLFGRRIAGLNGPFSATLEQTSHWENLGRDPVTGVFFLNE